MSIDYNSPLHIQWNVDEEGNSTTEEILNEQIVVSENKAYLKQIPEKYYRINVADMVEIDIDQEIKEENKFKCDYRTGALYFHHSKEGQTITVEKYNGRGVIMYPFSRIYTRVEGGNIVETLGNIVEDGTDAITAYGGIVQAITDAESKTTMLNSRIVEANTTKNNLDESISSANTIKSDLATSISTANTTKTNLDNSNSTAQITKSQLDTSVDNANISKTDLNTSISNAQTEKTSLDHTISGANTAKSNLDGSISTADTSKTNLDTSISGAGTKKSELDTSISNAINKKNELDGSVSIAESTKTFLDQSIANGDILSKNNTTPYAPTSDYHPATKKYVDENDINFFNKITDTSDHIIEGSTNKFMTTTEKTKLGNIAEGAEVNRTISDAVDLSDSNTSASAKAVKAVNDKAVDNINKIGALTGLNTTNKSNLVDAVNENEGRLNTIETQISTNINQQTKTLTNTNPTEHITAKQNCGVDVEVGGEMVVNLLGRDGDCKSLGDWGGYNSTVALGEGIKATSLGNASYLGLYKDANQQPIKENGWYFGRFRVKIPSTISKNVSVAKIYTSQGVYSNTIMPSERDEFIDVFVKMDVTDYTLISNIGVLIYSGSGTFANTDYAIFEKVLITKMETGEENLNYDELVEKYPYTNSAQPLLNPTVEVCGKNLSPLNNVDVKIEGNGELTYIPVKPNTTYTISASSVTGGDSKLKILSRGKDYQYTDIDFHWFAVGGNLVQTRTLSADTYYLAIKKEFTTTSITVNELMLEQGTTPYEPYQGGQIIFPTELAKIDTYQDKLTYKDGVAKVDREVKHVVLDGSLDYWTQANYTGYKNIALQSISDTIESLKTLFAVKYNGKILQSTGTYTIYDRCYPAGGSSYITIANTDSGWGEYYTPEPEEIKAYFNGYCMRIQGQIGVPYNGTGVKEWTSIYPKSDGSWIITPTLPTESYDTWTSYQLYYALQQPIKEEIQPIILGDGVNLVEGQNTLTVKSGVVWEKAEPVLYNGNYHINYEPQLNSCVDYKVETFIKVVKIINNVKTNVTNEWTVATNTAYGNERIWLSETDYDPQSTYYVLYQVLQEDYNCQIQEVEVSYEDNIRGALNKAVETIANLQSDFTKYQFMTDARLLELEVRLNALEP